MKSKNILILSLARALSQTAPPIVVLLGGIVGVEMAPTPALATLPIALMVVGLASFVIPASLIMRKIGRKRGFLLGVVIAAVGALLATYALSINSFVLFSTATFLIGMNRAFVEQYRFAAVESVDANYAGRAVSYVLVGDMIAAFLGPEIVKRTQGWLEGNFFGAAFVVMAGLYLLAFILLSFMEDSKLKAADTGKKGRPLGEILRQKNFMLAIMAGAVSYGAMTFVMTATPLQMNGTAGFDLNDTAWIIQSHIIAMYLPSLFTGFLIERLGLFRIMVSGAIILLASSIVSYFSVSLNHYWVGLVLLGLGWNLLFVGATVLLTHTYSAAERFKTQATNDFLVFGTQATASFSAGSVLFFSGWDRINLIGFGVVLAAFFVLIYQRKGLPKGRASA